MLSQLNISLSLVSHSIDLAGRRKAAVAEFSVKVFALENTTHLSQVLIPVLYNWNSRAWDPPATWPG